MTINGLPVMDDVARVFADEVGLNFRHGGCAGFGASFQDWFAEANDSFIGMDFEEEPTGLDKYGFQFCDPKLRFKVGRTTFTSWLGSRIWLRNWFGRESGANGPTAG